MENRHYIGQVPKNRGMKSATLCQLVKGLKAKRDIPH